MKRVFSVVAEFSRLGDLPLQNFRSIDHQHVPLMAAQRLSFEQLDCGFLGGSAETKKAVT